VNVVIGFARNVLGLTDAAHAEYDPYASRLIITPLSCSLALCQALLAVWSYRITQAVFRIGPPPSRRWAPCSYTVTP
jgi:hypothetical protein